MFAFISRLFGMFTTIVDGIDNLAIAGRNGSQMLVVTSETALKEAMLVDAQKLKSLATKYAIEDASEVKMLKAAQKAA